MDRGVGGRGHYLCAQRCKTTELHLCFIVERAIHLCLEDFQETAALQRVNTYPLVDFTSFDLVIQFASLYSSNNVEY